MCLATPSMPSQHHGVHSTGAGMASHTPPEDDVVISVVFSCIGDVFACIGDAIMGLVAAIAGCIECIVAAIADFFAGLVHCLTCGCCSGFQDGGYPGAQKA
ncbi:hypothetical protein CVT26_016182 [Gymnopilus dilepis]|uniref:Uncharacterized protein n=1 Tax=Gymnopilus dilepis TaxID=231916 RepID=A0A409XZ13_9AGAR|nr:hypothetical protein CVT26_016182 [Gymnopilus dilepis]